MLAPNMYVKQHNKVALYIHWRILKDIKSPTTQHWYNHKPLHTTHTEDHTIMWDMPIPTDIPIPNNRPDIIIHNKKLRTCLLIDISIPQDQNITKKTSEKILKYKHLEIELQQCWNLSKIQTVPVVIGALGTVSTSIEKYLQLISPNLNFQMIQKTTLIGTQQILRRSLTSSQT